MERMWVGIPGELVRPVQASCCTLGQGRRADHTQHRFLQRCIPAVITLRALNHLVMESTPVTDHAGAKSPVAL